jgi:protein TonB
MTELAAPRRWAWMSSIGLHVLLLLLLALWLHLQPKPQLNLPEPISLSLVDAPTLRRDSGMPGPAKKSQVPKGPAPAAPQAEVRRPAPPQTTQRAGTAPARQTATTRSATNSRPTSRVQPRPAGDWRSDVAKRQADLKAREQGRLAALGNGNGDGVISGSGGGDAGEAGGELSGRQLLHEVRPTYPADALRDRVSGRVLVAITVGADGSVKRASIAASSGDGRLDSAARAAIGQWRFAALPEDLPAVDTRGTVPVTFWFRPR